MNALFREVAIANEPPVGRAESDRLAHSGCPHRHPIVARAASPIACRAFVLTISSASAGRTWAVMIIRPAVSRGSARPTGLNGSCKLSAPAAMLTPAVAQRPDRGDAAWHRDLVLAAEEEQIGVGEGDHRDAGGRDLVGDLALAVLGLQDQRHAMARGDRMRKAGRDDALGKILQREHRRIEGLVGVQIDGQSPSAASVRKPSLAAAGSVPGAGIRRRHRCPSRWPRASAPAGSRPPAQSTARRTAPRPGSRPGRAADRERR